MTTTTPTPAAPERRVRTRGFSLVEVLVSVGLSGMVMTAVLGSFLFLGRSGANISNYSEMEDQARNALEYFAEDTRQASAVTWHSATSVTLLVNTTPVTYTYDASATTFTRQIGTGSPTTLLSGITEFSFKAYTITTVPIVDFSTAAARTSANRETKQIQISLTARRKDSTVVAATNTVLSARFILRNKRVTV